MTFQLVFFATPANLCCKESDHGGWEYTVFTSSGARGRKNDFVDSIALNIFIPDPIHLTPSTKAAARDCFGFSANIQ
jgi:hypothetical protein